MKLRVNFLRSLAEPVAMLAIDALLVIGVFQLAVFIRTKVLPLVYVGFPVELPFRSLLGIWWIFLLWMVFFYYEGLYNKRFSHWDEVKALWKVSFFSTVGVFAIVSMAKLGGSISRTVVIIMGIVSLFLPIVRLAMKRALRKFGLFKRKVLILGAGETGRLIADALRKEPNYGYDVVGFLDDDPEKVGSVIDGIKVHRGVDRAKNYLKMCGIKDVFIAMPGAGRERLQGLINALQHKAERVLFVPDMFGIAVVGTSLQHFFNEAAFALEVKNNLERLLNILIKRFFDAVVSVVLMPILSVPMAVMAFLIRLDSKGPALFSQERIGKYGKPFKCIKFRTMYEDAEDRLRELLKNDAGAKSEYEQYWKLKNDPRVTRVGRFLRATSLDELPQIFNVLRGEMSLVGPRPYLPREREDIGEHYDTILLIKPGMTGLWQVSGRSGTSYAYRIALDLWYVRNWNLWLDIMILFKTVKVVFKREGAY